MTWLYIIIGGFCLSAILIFIHHQRRLSLRAHLMQEAIRNRDFTFRLPVRGMFPGERAMQKTLNKLGEIIRQQVSQNEVESWERLTRVLTHEMMNATAPITSISQSLLSRPDVKGSALEDGILAIYETSRHLSDFVTSYRKMSELEEPVLNEVILRSMIEDVSRKYPQLSWKIDILSVVKVYADAGMLRQVLMNLAKNAVEAGAKNMVVEMADKEFDGLQYDIQKQIGLYIGNDGVPIPAENRQSLFVPFFTTKRTGSGIGLSLSRRMMIQQGGSLELSERPRNGCHVAFLLTIGIYNRK